MSRPAADVFIVDAGNTKIGMTAVRDGRIVARARLDRDAGHETGWKRAWDAVVSGMIAVCGRRLPLLLASVAPAQNSTLWHGLRRHGLRRMHVVSWRDPWPFALDVHDPHTVGVDRLAHVAGLVAKGMRRAVAVGTGTAVIVDVLDDGRFVGGGILPGVDLAAHSLRSGTAQLPRVHVRRAVPARGRETRAAIESGVLHGVLYGVAGLAGELAQQTGPGTPIVVTGGLAASLAAILKRCSVDPDLLVHGLACLQGRLAKTR